METTVVTVVIPTRNRAALLARALNSVFAQTFKDIEIIVVDDASNEDLGLQSSINHKSFRVVRNSSSYGAQKSRLIGARLARGRFVALLDSDDWWEPFKIEKQIEKLNQNERIVLASRVVAVKGSLQRAAPWRTLAAQEKVEDFLYVRQGMLQTSTILAEKEILISLLEPSMEFTIHNDTMLFLEAQKQGLSIHQMQEPLSFFDDNPRYDRISYDAGRIDASIAWFTRVSVNWSNEARLGFMLTDMVVRYVNTGQRLKAVRTLLSCYYPGIDMRNYLKKTIFVLFNGSPMRFFSK